jgi:hypothetical protein
MRNLLLVVFLCFSTPLTAQELNCKVTVNGDRVPSSDRTVLRDMERAFANFINTRKWTNDTYQIHEKINCTLFINISEMPSIGNFQASVQVAAARPIYNSNYESVLLNFADRDWDFEYVESLPLEYNDNTYISNLTSMLAFYAYVILGMDYDSFSPMGGNPYFQKALIVVTNAQQAGRAGWQALGSNRNRYSLIEALNNPQMAEMRKGTYTYHRLAMDNFEKTPDQSRDQVLEVLRSVQKAWRINPNSILVISFFDTKSNELVNIFSEGNIQVRREAYDILSAVDPKRDIYRKIISN